MKEVIIELNTMLNEALERGENIKNPINDLPLGMDLSDFGNAVGIVVQKFIERDSDASIEDFKHGLEHGISTIDGTHV